MEQPETPNWVTREITWIKAHETLLIILVASFLLYRTGQGVENLLIRRDEAGSQKATVTVQTDQSANDANQKVLDQLKSSADAQSRLLNQQIELQQKALAGQVKKDQSSTPSQIDTRWQQLLPLKPGSVTELDPANTKLTNDSANQTVQALEQIPVLQSQITSLTSELISDQKVIIQQNTVIVGLNKQILDEQVKDIADVKLEKAKARKSFLKGFKIGVIVGVISGEAVRLWAGKP